MEAKQHQSQLPTCLAPPLPTSGRATAKWAETGEHLCTLKTGQSLSAAPGVGIAQTNHGSKAKEWVLNHMARI